MIKYHILSYHIILYILLRNIMSYLRPLGYRGRIPTSLVSQPNFLLHFFSCLLSWAFNGFRFLSLTDNRSLFSHTHHPTPIHGGLNLCILCTFIVKLKFFTSWKIFMFLSMKSCYSGNFKILIPQTGPLITYFMPILKLLAFLRL